MRVVIGTSELAHPGGTESYCLTVARALGRLGHEVTLCADELGPLAEQAAASGLDIATMAGELPRQPDALFVNDAITAGVLGERYPQTRLVYCVHSEIFEVQVPPLADGLIATIVALSDRMAAFARSLPLDVPVVRLAQPIDTDLFVAAVPPRARPRQALLLGNYLDGARRAALVESWTAAGIECVQVGVDGEVAFDVRPEIARADIVVAKGRAALEGMACGKAVYVFDAFGGDGWVSANTYPELEADNFAGLGSAHPVDRHRLTLDLDRYEPDMGWFNRELTLRHHGARPHARALVDVLRGPPARKRDATSAAGAAAHVLRTAWRTERRAIGLERQVAELQKQLSECDAELAAVRERAAALEVELASARGLIDTRRAQVGLAVGRWLDRVRGRR